MRTRTILSFMLMLICTSLMLGQAPRFDKYSQMGFNAGFAFGKDNPQNQTGATLGIVHSCVTTHMLLFDASASRLALMNVNGSTKFGAMELLMLDIGFGYPFIDDKVYVGFSPFSINWTKSGEYGLSVLAKCIVKDNIVVEGKIIPISYTKNYTNGGVPMLKNNTYIGVHYWFDEDFSLGLRYNRYGDFSNYSLLVSWNLFEM